MAWQQLIITVPSTEVLSLEEQLLNLGALSITLQDANDEPILEPALGTMPLWSLTVLSALFNENDDVLKIINLVQQAFPLQTLGSRIELLPDQDWEREWLKYFKPIHFGHNLWIVPTGYEPPDPEGTTILLDPGLAFGTGTHPTTAMCLSALAELNLTDKTVLDYGCGSGILAIAAAKLGASNVWAIDYDPQAVSATLDNAQRNTINPAHFLVGQNSALPTEYSVNVLVANILTNALITLAPTFAHHTKPGGLIILSGILANQIDDVRDAYRPYFEISPPRQTEDWICLLGIKKIDSDIN